MTPRRPKQELTDVHRTTGDVSSDEIGVHFFEGGWRKNPARQDALAETGREALDLVFEGLEHVELGAVRDVAICPGGVLPFRRARGIEQTRLRHQDKGTLGMTPTPHGRFGRGYFAGTSTQMHGCRAQALRCFPRNR